MKIEILLLFCAYLISSVFAEYQISCSKRDEYKICKKLSTLVSVKRVEWGEYLDADLDVSNFHIQHIEPMVFNGLDKLLSLNLANNQIEVIEANSFYGVTADEVSLENNNLREVKNGAFRGSNIKILILGNHGIKNVKKDAWEINSSTIINGYCGNPY